MALRTPHISVIVPTRDRPWALVRAVRSILTDAYSHLEVLIVDDASTQELPELVELSHPHIRYLRRQVRGGPSGARNTGIKEARGSLIVFLDDDDELLPGYLTHIMQAFKDPHVAFAWGGWRIVRDTPHGEVFVRDKLYRSRFRSREHARRHFQGTLPGGTGGLAVRRSVLMDVGLFDETLHAAVDTELLIRLGQAYDYAVIPEVIYKVHMHDTGQVTTLSRVRAVSYERIIRKHAAYFDRHRGLRARLWLVVAGIYLVCKDRPEALRAVERAFVAAPWSPLVWHRAAALAWRAFAGYRA